MPISVISGRQAPSKRHGLRERGEPQSIAGTFRRIANEIVEKVVRTNTMNVFGLNARQIGLGDASGEGDRQHPPPIMPESEKGIPAISMDEFAARCLALRPWIDVYCANELPSVASCESFSRTVEYD
jgi:hypothetical protein